MEAYDIPMIRSSWLGTTASWSPRYCARKIPPCFALACAPHRLEFVRELHGLNTFDLLLPLSNADHLGAYRTGADWGSGKIRSLPSKTWMGEQTHMVSRKLGSFRQLSHVLKKTHWVIELCSIGAALTKWTWVASIIELNAGCSIQPCLMTTFCRRNMSGTPPDMSCQLSQIWEIWKIAQKSGWFSEGSRVMFKSDMD